MELITGGCSFSDISEVKTWPCWLSEIYNAELTSTGQSSSGNGLIARKVYHAVHEKLKTTDSENILVGVMWSGPSRMEFYHSTYNPVPNVDGWTQNPIIWPEGDLGGWTLINAWWKIKLAKIYYSYFYDEIGSQIQTLENILRLQNYLKSKNIKYFMTIYHDEVFKVKEHPQLNWLYEQVDWNYFLPGESCYRWCKEKSNLPLPPEPTGGFAHPSEEQHELYTKLVIKKFLKTKYKI